MIRSVILSLTLLGLVACSETGYEKNISIASDGWHKDSVVRFDFEVKDLTQPYQMSIYLRNDNAYPYANIYLFVNLIHPDGVVTRDTAQYDLADAYGKWLGKGWCANYDNELLFQDNYRFAATGVYRIEITQAMRQLRLKGIKDVGFCLRKKEVNGEK